jgi:hypothetical protein
LMETNLKGNLKMIRETAWEYFTLLMETNNNLYIKMAGKLALKNYDG